MQKTLKKQLGLLDVYAICSGAMISSGLFVLPSIAASKVGPAVIFAYLLSGLLLIPSMLSKAEMATAMPRAGGTYFYVSRSLGGMFGTIDGVGVWLALIESLFPVQKLSVESYKEQMAGQGKTLVSLGGLLEGTQAADSQQGQSAH